MVFKAIEIIMRELVEKDIGNYQHGFIRSKGCQTASREIIYKLRGNKEYLVYEFDLKSFFNKVNVNLVCVILEEKFGAIGSWIRAITVGSIPKINKSEIRKENELVIKQVSDT